MFEIKIASLHMAQTLITEGWPTAILSVIHSEAIEPTGDHHKVLDFDDLTAPVPGGVMPALHHIATALEATRSLTDADRLLIHCYLGESRSPAMAIGIMVQHGLSIPEAFARCYALRPQMRPNPAIIGLLDEALDLNGELEHFAAHWRRP